jgi:hypothetical protein
MRPTILRGGIDLTQARVGWYDAKDTWPAWLCLEGSGIVPVNTSSP